MAYTLADLRTLVRQRADMEGSSFVSDTEITRYINDAVKELFELLVVTYGQEYFYALSTATTTSGDSTYLMPAGAFKLLRVDVLTAEGYEPLRPWKFPTTLLGATGSTRRRPGRLPLYRWSGDNIIFEPEPPGAYTYRLHYVPRPTRLVSASDVLGRPYDDWSEYVVLGAAIKCLMKEESDTSALAAERTALHAHIVSTAPSKDAGYPQTIVDDRWRHDPGEDDGGWTAAALAEAAASEGCDMEGAKVSGGPQDIPTGGALTEVTMDTFIAHFGEGTALDPSQGDMEVLEDGWYDIRWNVRFNGPTALPPDWYNSVATIDDVALPVEYETLSEGSDQVAVCHYGHAVVAVMAGQEIGIHAAQNTGDANVSVTAVLTVLRVAAYDSGDIIPGG